MKLLNVNGRIILYYRLRSHHFGKKTLTRGFIYYDHFLKFARKKNNRSKKNIHTHILYYEIRIKYCSILTV